MTSRRSARLSSKAIAVTNDSASSAGAKQRPDTKRRAAQSEPASTTNTAGAAAEGNARLSKKHRAPVTASKELGTLAPSSREKQDETAVADADSNTAPTTPKAKKLRPANPKATNAPLQTPGGTRILKSYPTELFEPNGSQTSPSKSQRTTTDNILEQAVAHLLAVDPRLKPLIDKHTCNVLTAEALNERVEPFNALCSSIMGQQVSGAAAAAIKRRFIALFEQEAPVADAHPKTVGEEEAAASTAAITPSTSTSTPKAAAFFPTPAQVAATPIERLRTAGLSGRKAEYIQGLAQRFSTGQLSAQLLIDATDDELLQNLIAVRGLGRWSVEMFAFFALKRLDIFSTGDLGVQRGVAAYVGKDVNKLKSKGGGDKWKYMKEAEMLEVANRFVPYRSLFMWYMWRIEDVDLTVMGS